MQFILFKTVPLKLSRLPGPAGPPKQFCVTAMRGVVASGQVADAVTKSLVPLQASWALAVTVLLTEQASAGAVKLKVKFADPPGARAATVNTRLGTDWLLSTATLLSVMLPALRTVPV